MEVKVMETKKLKINGKGHSNEHITFYVADYHTEYPLPEMEGARIRQQYDGFDIGDALDKLEKADLLKRESDDCLDLVLVETIKEIKNEDQSYLVNYPDTETYSQWDEGYTHIWSITIWSNEGKKLKERIENYYKQFKAAAYNAAMTAGGDDSFFDYMPNYIDMFMQFAEMLGKQEDFDEFIDAVHNDRDCFEEHGEYLPKFTVKK